MKFTNGANLNCSSLKGEVGITYSELVTVFGLPDYGPNADMDKVTCEWNLEFEDGTKASIYDWKTGRTPFGYYEWHIGGYDYTAVERVLDAIKMAKDPLVKMVKDFVPNERVTG